ncbi:MAG: hypothetical protein KDC98_19105, partial [Planctomycetes bacterium]|nr:hypothetical protein [Planctomycetota bacterium]
REAVPVRLPGSRGLAFPDFELRREGSAERWLCEIAGLRDRAALPAKLLLLDADPRLLLCIAERAIPAALRAHPRLLPFRRRVDVARVLAIVEAWAAGHRLDCGGEHRQPSRSG